MQLQQKNIQLRAVRPKNSRMSKQKLIDNGFNPLPTWQDAVRTIFK